jgi:hypothetical protein
MGWTIIRLCWVKGNAKDRPSIGASGFRQTTYAELITLVTFRRAWKKKTARILQITVQSNHK